MAHQCRWGRRPAFSLPSIVIFVIGDRFRVSWITEELRVSAIYACVSNFWFTIEPVSSVRFIESKMLYAADAVG